MRAPAVAREAVLADENVRLVRAVITPKTSGVDFIVEEKDTGARRKIVWAVDAAGPVGLNPLWWKAVVGEVRFQQEQGIAGLLFSAGY